MCIMAVVVTQVHNASFSLQLRIMENITSSTMNLVACLEPCNYLDDIYGAAIE